MCVFTAGNVSTAVVADVTVLDNRVVIDRLVLGRVVDDMRDRVVVDGLSDWNVVVAVSYTHLDVYKRQPYYYVGGKV